MTENNMSPPQEWYIKNPALQMAEIKAMERIHPEAKMGYLDNGQMYWVICLRPQIMGEHTEWIFLVIYESDHPSNRWGWGGSVKFYPAKPNYQEMIQMVENASLLPVAIPHTLRDKYGRIYLSLDIVPEDIKAVSNGTMIISAASLIRYAFAWITRFSLGLRDPQYWGHFCGHCSKPCPICESQMKTHEQ